MHCFSPFDSDHAFVIYSRNIRQVHRKTISNKNMNAQSPARISSTMGRLPDVMYLVETPRATSGWARSRFNSPLSAAVLEFCVFASRLVGPTSSSSLPHSTVEKHEEPCSRHNTYNSPRCDIRIELDVHGFRRGLQPVSLVICLLDLMLLLVNLLR